jgi:glycine cleavage system H protein
MNVPEDLRYTKEHEWCRADGKIASIGITDHAQERLGDIVYLELPKEGDEVKKDEAFGVVESVKAVSDLFSPVDGKVVEVNDPLLDSPATVNDDPYEEGWMIKVQMTDPRQLEELMTAEEYQEYVAESGE